jgi:hypothetical protein
MEYQPLARTLNDEDYVSRGIDPGILGTLGMSISEGVDATLFLGTSLRALNTTDPNRPIESWGPGGRIYKQETPEEVAKRGDKLYQTPEELKAEFPEIPFEKGMTKERAGVLQEYKDAAKIREYWMQKRPYTAFFGQLIGNAVDPINYIPIFGEGAVAGAVARTGSRVIGRALVGSVDAAANTAIASVLTAPERASLGYDDTWEGTAGNIAFSALAGGVFGAGHAFFSRARDSATKLSPTPANQIRAKVVLNDALDGILKDEAVNLNVNSQAILNESFTAYHGGPAKFDRFSSEHIGEGEGNQSYGHALYFGEARGTGEDYRISVTDKATNIARTESALRTPERAIEYLDKLLNEKRLPVGYTPELVQEAISKLKSGEPLDKGYLYEVQINANKDHLLDHDKPLAEQSDYVKEKLKAAADNIPKASLFSDALTKLQHSAIPRWLRGEDPGMAGGTLTKAMESVLSGPSGVARFLRGAGIPGVKYLDQLSRGEGKGTQNFAIFDDNLIKILKRNDEPLNFTTPAPEAPHADFASANAAVKARLTEKNPFDAEIKAAKESGIDIETGHHDLEPMIQQLKKVEDEKGNSLLSKQDEAELEVADKEWQEASLEEQIGMIGFNCVEDG